MFFRVTERLAGIAHARNSAVMVGAPDVDKVIESAAELLFNVSNVGAKVGVRAGRLLDDAILVIAKRRALEPECTIALLQPSGCAQLLNGAIHKPFGVERTF